MPFNITLLVEFNRVLQPRLSMWCPPVSATFDLNVFSARILSCGSVSLGGNWAWQLFEVNC